MNPLLNRRSFLSDSARGLSGIALASLLQESGLLGASPIRPSIDPSSFARARHAFRCESQERGGDLLFGSLSHVDTLNSSPSC